MRRRSRGRRQRRAGRRNAQPGLDSGGPDPRGDIPHAAKRTYVTKSCPIPPLTQMCTFRIMSEPAAIIASASAAVSAAVNFQVNSLDGASALLANWDQYKIDCIRFSIIPANNAIGLQTATNILVPLYCVIDYDDSSALGSQAAARKYDNCIILEPGESLVRTFRPKVANSLYSGAFTSFGNIPAPWIDAVSSTVQHYGIKYYVPQSTGTVLQQWEVQAEYFISFRSLVS